MRDRFEPDARKVLPAPLDRDGIDVTAGEGGVGKKWNQEAQDPRAAAPEVQDGAEVARVDAGLLQRLENVDSASFPRFEEEVLVDVRADDPVADVLRRDGDIQRPQGRDVGGATHDRLLSSPARSRPASGPLAPICAVIRSALSRRFRCSSTSMDVWRHALGPRNASGSQADHR